MLKQVAAGSNEPLNVDVSDRLGGVTTLSGVKYEVYDVGASAWKIGTGAYAGATAGTASGMTAICQVNTASWAAGVYALYVWFQVGGNNIRKGPFYFNVVA